MNIPLREYFALLRRYLRPQWLRVFGLAFLLLGGIGLQLVSPQVIRVFIDAAESGATQTALLLAAALFLVTVLAAQGMRIATTYVSETVAWRATNGLRADLTRHVLELDMGFHKARTLDELLARIDGDVDGLANFFSQFVLQILNGLLLTAGVLLLLFREDWRLGLILTVFAASTWLFTPRASSWPRHNGVRNVNCGPTYPALWRNVWPERRIFRPMAGYLTHCAAS